MSTDTKIKTLIFNKLTQEQYNNADKVQTEFYLTPDTSIDSSEKGVANGVASLDANGKVPLSQLPDNIGGGAPTLTWHKNNTGSSITIADTSSANLVKVYKNGILLEPIEDYTISETTLTLTTELISTDKITTEVF